MQDYKELLTKRKKELEDNLMAIGESAKPVDLKDPIGRLSRMDAIGQQQMALNAKRQIETNLKLVEQAFERLEKGEYGFCLACEDEISEKRLKAKPETSFCINCQK